MSPRPFFKIAGLLAATICCGSSVAVEVEAVVEVRSAMVVAFLPPRLQSSKDGEALNAASHLSFAVADTTACVKPLKLVVRTVYANRIVLQHASRREVVAVPATGQGIRRYPGCPRSQWSACRFRNWPISAGAIGSSGSV